MKYDLQNDSEKPIYLQLYEQLKNDIINGVYPAAGKLPSKRLIGEELGISVITVEHAYGLLADEGYIEAKERSGYYVAYREGDIFTAPVAYAGNRNIPADIHAQTADFPFSVYARTMRKVLSDYGEAILVKSPNNGCPELRLAISDYLARSRGIDVDPRQIVIGSGAEYLYGLLVEVLGRHRIYALESPSYEKIELVYRANGVKCDFLQLGHDGIKSGELARTAATVLHITPYRSFPSGVTASASKRREYIRWAAQQDRFIVEDDFESEFTLSTKPEDTVFSLADRDNVIYVNTFSKTMAPSIRIGYMVLPEGLLELFEKKVGFYSCAAPAFEQYVLAEFIANGDFERHINRVRRKMRSIRKQQMADNSR